jgi:hypothetical protein
MHYVDTLILPLLFSVFLIALVCLGWKDIQVDRRRRREREAKSGAHDADEKGTANRRE